jgi:hypothetical protein
MGHEGLGSHSTSGRAWVSFLSAEQVLTISRPVQLWAGNDGANLALWTTVQRPAHETRRKQVM